MHQRQKKILVCIIGVIVLLCLGLYAGRNYFLQRIASAQIDEIEKKYGLQVQYETLKLEGCNIVCLRKLSIIPAERDTLLNLNHLDLKLNFWKLLTGNMQVKEVTLDKLHLNLQKNDSIANYDFLFQTGTTHETAEKQTVNYAQQIHRMLNWIYGRIPDNGQITHFYITERHNEHSVTIVLPELLIKENYFDTQINIKEDSLPTQQWAIKGKLLPADRSMDFQLYALGKRNIELPYLQRRIGADIHFDTLTCCITENIKNSNYVKLQGNTHISGLEIYHQALSPDTIKLDNGAIDYQLNFQPQTIELDSASTFYFNQLNFHPYICINRHNEKEKEDNTMGRLSQWHITASINKPWFPAQELFGSLPKGLFGALEGIQTEGELAYHGLLDADFAQIDSLKLESELKKKNFRIIRYGTTNLSKMNGEFEYTAYENGQPVRTFPIGPSWEHFTPLDQISPLLQMAVMQSEDGAFFYHQGFLMDALQEALIQDLKERRFARGGSTISMQLVKNVFLNRKKNITRKLEEALIVWLIENQALTSKERMYEVYMNIIEWGPLIYGAGEASKFYFNKRPSQLTVEEAIFLASIVPKPKHFRSSFDENGQLRESLTGYYHLIARRLAKKGLISEDEAERIRPVINVSGAAKDYLQPQETDSTSVVISSQPITPDVHP